MSPERLTSGPDDVVSLLVGKRDEMEMMVPIRRVADTREIKSVNDPKVILQEFIVLKNDEKALKSRLEESRKKVLPLLESSEPDSNGHRAVELDEEWEGVVGVRYQRSVSVGLDMDAAERILKEKGLWEKCAPPVPQLDNDAVYAALYNEEITEADVDQIYPQKERFSVVLLK